jgi:hypothetical protein
VVEENEMGWDVAQMGEKRNANRLLVGKPEGKRPLGRQRRMWVGNIKMNLTEIGWGWRGLDWYGEGQGQAGSSCECSNERSGSIKCWEYPSNLI